MNASHETELNSYHLSYLPLITSCMLVIMVLTVLRDAILLDFSFPRWLVTLNVVAALVVVIITVLSQLGKVSAEQSQILALIGMLCVGSKPIASLVLQGAPLPLYIAIVLFSTTVVFLSIRYMLFTVLIISSVWVIFAVSRLTAIELLATLFTQLLAVSLGVFILMRRQETLVTMSKLKQRVTSLESILQLCSNCKKTRDEKGDWKTVEEYIESSNENLRVSHGICPPCRELLYGDLGKAGNNPD
ncbi:MAG: hypothetical protein O2971_19225 [Proteobacteria bacterium]|nr:hypothetical protein [Pseudomonadota bacterium]